MKKNIVQLKAEINRMNEEQNFCSDMAYHYNPMIMGHEESRYLQAAREAEAVYRERRDELHEKWGRFVR